MNTLDVDAVLFDLGGTCLEIVHEAVAEAGAAHRAGAPSDWAHAGERQGRAHLEAAIASGEPADRVWRAFFIGMVRVAGVAEPNEEAVFQAVRDYHRTHHLWNRIMPGMPEALRELVRRGYRVAAVSNSDGRAERVLEGLGFLDAFEFVIDSHDVGVEKPDPRIFRLATDRLALPPSRCAYVGDVMAIDVEGSRRAGLVPVLLDAYGAYPDVAGVARATDARSLLELFPPRAA